MTKYNSQDQSEVNEYQDRWILEYLQHTIAPIVKKLKRNILLKYYKGLGKTVEELEKATTQMILDERKRIRKEDGPSRRKKGRKDTPATKLYLPPEKDLK